MLYNSRYWWFFLYQGNRLTKYLVHTKIWRPKPCLLMFAPLDALDGFHLLLSTQLTADLTPDPCFIHCHIFTQKLPFVALKQLQTKIWIVDALLFLIDCQQTQHPLWTQLSHWQMFMKNGEYPAFSYLQLLYYISRSFNLQSTTTSLQTFCIFCLCVCVCVCVFRVNWRIWPTWAFRIICVCTTAFKVSIPPLNRYFRRGRVQITLIKPLLCLNSIFSIRKQCFIKTRNSDFFIVLKICNS